MVMERPGAIGVLALEEKDAWAEYLATTQELSEQRYREIEPWAWARLGARLRDIHARRVGLGGGA